MKLENASSVSADKTQSIRKNGTNNHAVTEIPWAAAKPAIEIPFSDNEMEKQRVMSVIMADVKWTINTDCKVTYISPFIENCLGNDAKLTLKHIASKYLTPSSIMACLIELEELKEIMRTFKYKEPRKLFVELSANELNIERMEIISSAIFDQKGNVVGISGLCNFLL